MSLYEALLQDINSRFPEKAILSLEDIAEFLDCPRKSVYQWTKRPDAQKRLPALVAGKTIRVPKTALVQWLAAGCAD